MDTRFLKRSALLAVISMLVALSVLTVATYAWFTANSSVSTSRIETSTDGGDLTLYVKAPTDAAFTGNVCELIFNNNTALYPVSTADLQHFVYCPGMNGDQAERFSPVEDLNDQTLLSYGTVDLRAELTGAVSGARVAVYLDDAGELGNMVQAEADSLLLNAARLGLALQGDPDSARIFYLSDEENGEGKQVLNTVIDNEVQPADIVLQSDGTGAVTAVPDPAVPLSACMIDDDGAGQPLFILEPGVDYTIDVFFYLEGCDPDCSDSIELNAADFGLSFYATLAAEA